MAKKFTHTGKMVGCDNRTRDGFFRIIKLRETSNFWVDEYGEKFRKLTGSSVNGGSWPMYRLEVNTIRSL